jgi:hypothetical protein
MICDAGNPSRMAPPHVLPASLGCFLGSCPAILPEGLEYCPSDMWLDLFTGVLRALDVGEAVRARFTCKN